MLVHQQQQSYLLLELSDRSFSSDEWLTIGVARQVTSSREASEANHLPVHQQQQPYLLSELSDRSFSSDEWLTIGVALRESFDPEA